MSWQIFTLPGATNLSSRMFLSDIHNISNYLKVSIFSYVLSCLQFILILFIFSLSVNVENMGNWFQWQEQEPLPLPVLSFCSDSYQNIPSLKFLNKYQLNKWISEVISVAA